MGQSGSTNNRGANARTPDEGTGGNSQEQTPTSSSEHSVLSPSSQPPSWSSMDGPTYACEYLGFSALSKPATGIQMLQQPVKDLYLKFRKHLSTGGVPRHASFKVTPAGLLVALTDGKDRSEMFFDLGSINLIEAVRFTLLANEKKPKAIFVPVDESRGPVSDKTAFSLDKAFHFLIKSGHHPLLVCVLRRPKGVKMMDCHVFALDTPENALYIVSLVQRLQQPGGAGKDFPGGVDMRQDAGFNRGVRGDVIRTEFGDYSVYRGGPQPFELRDEHFRGGGGVEGGGGGGGSMPTQMDLLNRGGGHPNPRETYPAESAERPRYGWSYDKAQGGEEYKRVSGQYMGDGRPTSAAQVPDASPPPPAGQFPRGEVRAGGQFPGDGRPAADYPRGGDRLPARGGSTYDHLGNYRRQEYERSEVVHMRERSGDSADSRSGFDRSSASGSDRLGSGRPYDDFGPPGRAAFPEPRGSQRSDAPPRVMDRPQSPVMRHPLNGQYPPTGSPTPGQGRLSPHHGMEHSTSPTSAFPPGGLAGVPGSRTSDAPAYSMSNRESRGDQPDDPQGNKPVAKVPPHLKGVKVLPSNFLDVKLKPKPKQTEESNEGYDNQKNVVAQYKQLQEMEAQGFKAFGDPDVERGSEKRSYNNNWHDDLKPDDRDDQMLYRRQAADGDRRYIEEYSSSGGEQFSKRGYEHRYDDGAGQMSDKSRHSSPGYGEQFGPAAPGSAAGNWRSKSSYEMGQRSAGQYGAGGTPQHAYDMGQGYDRGGPQPHQQGYSRGANVNIPPNMNAAGSSGGDEGQMGRKKDAEIANMFSNFRLQGREDPYAQDKNNFEHGLGYLP